MSEFERHEVAKTYYSFVTSSLQYLFHVSITNPEELYAALANWILFLPKEVKSKAQPRMDEITSHLRKIRSFDTYQTRQHQLVYAIRESKKLLNEIMIQLDEGGYLEEKPITPKRPSDQKLSWQT